MNRIRLFPRTFPGITGFLLAALFSLLAAAKTCFGVAMSTNGLFVIGCAGSLLGIAALIKRDFSPLVLYSICTGFYICLWLLSGFLFLKK